MQGALPSLDSGTVHSQLSTDAEVRVVDLVDIGRSRGSIRDTLVMRTQKPESRTITSIEGDEELDEAPQQPKATTIRYTVRDSAGQLAYMLPVDGPLAHLKIGSQFSLLKGTEIWRTVLVPRSSQISTVSGGTNLNVAQQLARTHLP